MTHENLPPLALTMGEPAGIGPEIALKAWEVLRETGPAFAILADRKILTEASAPLGRTVQTEYISTMDAVPTVFRDSLPILHVRVGYPVKPGKPRQSSAGAVMASMSEAVDLVQAGEASGIVTNPIQKSSLTASGFRFPGHTEYLAHRAGRGFRARMMLAGEGLRVIPVTIHEPLGKAIARLTTRMIVEAGRDAAMALQQDFGIAYPRIAVAGLNPHAGEDGTMGREEIDIITPAVKALIREGIAAFGPLPPDTMFTPQARAGYDVALCMYHDQGLIPLKTLDMMGGVNVTLGLPFVRTSPDHGTALDIAGKGVASPSSLIAAIRLAAKIAATRVHNNKIAA